MIPQNLDAAELASMREETENESKKLASIEWLKASIQAQRLLEISDYAISAKAASAESRGARAVVQSSEEAPSTRPKPF